LKSPAFVLAVALLLLLTAELSSPPPAQADGVDLWIKVQSKNFLLVGNAGERELRRIITRLEQFRAVFKHLPISGGAPDSIIPTTVLVFRDDLAYRPFEPLYQGQPSDVAGAFQSSADINYITLSADASHVRSTYALAFHEYSHLLIKNSMARVPLWLNEGLAEFYSTFEVADGNRKIKLGQPIKSRAQTVRQRELLPLSTLFTVDYQSPYYNEARGREIFYAESWAFVHYLLNGRSNPSRRPQLLRYLELLASGHADEEAFRQAFQTDTQTLEKELRQYIRLGRYAEESIAFEQPLEFEAGVTATAMTSSEVKFYLGDLLLHAGRVEEAEPYLLDALKLDETLAPAQASLGLLRLQQNRFAEAVEALERAVALDSQNYLVHYRYADALSRAFAASELSFVGYYPPEALRVMRTELKRAIELAPRFVESYRLLAFVNLVVNERLEEAGELLSQAIKLAPERRELPFLLAQVHMRRDDLQSARRLLTSLLQTTDHPQLRTKAQALLESIAAREEQARRVKADAVRAEADEKPAGEVQPCDAPQPGPQKKPLRFNGEQVCGMLVRVDCDEGSVLLLVEAQGATLKLRSDALNRIRFVTYTSDVRGQITCGLRQPATPVLVTYRLTKGRGAQADGEVLAVEFIPKEWTTTQHAPAAP
jgi:tetratricopeptide (TPR) repeat protein